MNLKNYFKIEKIYDLKKKGKIEEIKNEKDRRNRTWISVLERRSRANRLIYYCRVFYCALASVAGLWTKFMFYRNIHIAVIWYIDRFDRGFDNYIQEKRTIKNGCKSRDDKYVSPHISPINFFNKKTRRIHECIN